MRACSSCRSMDMVKPGCILGLPAVAGYPRHDEEASRLYSCEKFTQDDGLERTKDGRKVRNRNKG